MPAFERGDLSVHLLFLVTADWYFCSHRLPLARAAVAAGHRVTVVTQDSGQCAPIRESGAQVLAVRFPRSGRAPWADLALQRRLVKEYRRLRPDVVHHVALKPVLFGAWPAHRAAVPVTVNAVAGLGYLFASPTLKARLLRAAVKPVLGAALRRSSAWTIVQNPDDRALLLGAGMLREDRVSLIPGSGVDLARFSPTVEPPGGSHGAPVVVLPARMLWDKGVSEFVAAARALRARGVRARFVLAGDSDPENHASVPETTLRAWQEEGVVEWWGRCDDMPQVYAQSAVVCLPSYREGLPKVLAEACAAGRPCVATDVPGCRDAVRHERNGLLVPPRDPVRLAGALARLIDDPDARREMGKAGRQLAESTFGDARIAQATLAIYRQALEGVKS